MKGEFENAKKNLLIAEDPRSKLTLEMAQKAARSNATVLITGETGVGKELLAQYIHHHSTFSDGPFISINCAALPDNMIEAILFGYEKGAFTNAVNAYPGKFEQANNGTLLLDEISEIPLSLQAKLLRVLQEREVERLGGKKIINVNVRIIAATNKELQQQVTTGFFRSDLYYRLNVICIRCMPLRVRPLDIIPLANYFIEKYSVELKKTPPTLTNEAQYRLMNYEWPGNIREMDNLMQRVLVMTSGHVIDGKDLEISITEKIDDVSAQVNDLLSKLKSQVKISEAKTILDVLEETEGSRSLAAKKLNMSPRTLRYKISKLKSIGLKVP